MKYGKIRHGSIELSENRLKGTSDSRGLLLPWRKDEREVVE